MSATLPIPIRFELPGDDWEAVEPESLGVRNAAFLAVRRNVSDSYSPTISVSGDWRNDDSSLEQIGDESLALLSAQGAQDVELLKRRAIGTEHAPALTQSIGASASIDGQTYDLRQAQAIQGIVDVDDPAKRIVLIYTFSSTFGQFDQYGPEFQRFMASVEVVPGTAKA